MTGLGYLYYLHEAGSPFSLQSLCQGQSEDQANNKIGLDQIISASAVNDTAKFGTPSGTMNAHLLDVRSTADVKLALKSQTVNAY